MEITEIRINAKNREYRKLKALGLNIKRNEDKSNSFRIVFAKSKKNKEREKEKSSKKEKEREYILRIYILYLFILENILGRNALLFSKRNFLSADVITCKTTKNKSKKSNFLRLLFPLGKSDKILRKAEKRIFKMNKINVLKLPKSSKTLGDAFASQRRIGLCFAKSHSDLDYNSDFSEALSRKKPKRISKNKTTLIQKDMVVPQFYEKLLEEIFKLGSPFVKHRKGSAVYQESIALLQKYFKKYRTNILDPFTLAKEYFSNQDFVYRPKKIGVPTFFKYSDYEKSNIPGVSKVNVSSWYNEFRKGRDHIEKNFMIVRTDPDPQLTNVMVRNWQNFKRVDSISAYEKRAFVIFTSKIKKYAKINKLSIRTILEVINGNIFKSENPMNIDNPMFFNSSYFFTQLLPQILVNSRIVKSKKYLAS